MKKDITSRQDIELLVNEFYIRVKQDSVIGFVFTDIAKVNWEKHLPVMYDFFENMLFYTGSYTGNPMELHKHINRILPLNETHFKQWEYLFCKVADEFFEGPTVELVKQRAKSISAIMQIKIKEANSAADKIY